MLEKQLEDFATNLDLSRIPLEFDMPVLNEVEMDLDTLHNLEVGRRLFKVGLDYEGKYGNQGFSLTLFWPR